MIDNMASPAPTLSMLLKANAGHSYIFFLSTSKAPLSPLVITKFFNFLFLKYFLATVFIFSYSFLSSNLNSLSFITNISTLLYLFNVCVPILL